MSRKRLVGLIAITSLGAASLSACGSRLTDAEVLQQASGQSALAPVAANPVVAPAEIPGAPAASVGARGDPASTVTVPGAVSPYRNAPAAAAQVTSGPKQAASAAAAAGKPVNIGSIGLWSGLVGQLMGGAKLGSQVSVAYINAHGGLNGHPTNLIVADDGGDPATGLALAKKMIDEDHVLAFLNNLNGTNSASVIPYITGRGIPIVGGTGLEPETWSMPDVFPGASSPRVQSMLTVKAGIDQGFKNVGIIYCTEFALLCKSTTAFVEANASKVGGSVVFKQQVSLAQPDFTSQCLAAKSAGVDNFLLFLDPNSVLRLADACAAQNYHPRYATVGVVMASNLTSSPNTEGLVGPPNSFPFSYSGPESADFRRAFIEVTGNLPTSNFQASSWVGGLILQEAAKRLPADPKPADLFAGLYAMKATTFGGLAPSPLSFHPGKPAETTVCGFMAQIHSQAFVVVGGLKPRCLSFGSPVDFR